MTVATLFDTIVNCTENISVPSTTNGDTNYLLKGTMCAALQVQLIVSTRDYLVSKISLSFTLRIEHAYIIWFEALNHAKDMEDNYSLGSISLRLLSSLPSSCCFQILNKYLTESFLAIAAARQLD